MITGNRYPKSVMLVCAVMAVLLASCTRTFVPIPPPPNDSPPIVKISNFSPGGATNIDKESVSSADGLSAQVTVSNNKKCDPPVVMIMAGASNPAGGVQELEVTTTMLPGSNPDLIATTTSSPNVSGQVPTSLSIFGYNDAPGPEAGNEPIFLKFDGGPLGCIRSGQFLVTATARNFNNQTTTLTETVSFELTDNGCGCVS